MPLRIMLCVVLLVVVLALTGCPKPQSTEVTPPPSTAPTPTVTANEASAAGGEEMASCPVLGTTMPKSKMIPVEHMGKTYYLCCKDCVPKFKADPMKYIEHPAKPLPPSSGM